MVHITKSTILVAALVAAPAFSAPVSSYLDELEARTTPAGRAAQKVAGNVLDAVGQSQMKDAVKKYTNPPAKVDPGLAEAARKATHPSKEAVDRHSKIDVKKGVTDAAKSSPLRKSRRDFEELEGRTTPAGRAAQKVAGNVLDAVGQSQMKDAVKKYTNPPAKVDPGLAEAARKATHPSKEAVDRHSKIDVKKGVIDAAKSSPLRKSRRDFEELEGRTTPAGRAAQKVAGNVLDAVGQSQMKDAVKKYTNPPAKVDPGLAEAARKATHPSKEAVDRHSKIDVKKGMTDAAKAFPLRKSHTMRRDFEDMDLYERNYEDFEDVFERELDDLEERDYDLEERAFDDLEEREFYYLNELD